MRRFDYRLSCILLSFLILGGCSFDDFVQLQTPSLIGTWKPKNTAFAPSRLTFLRDGTYEFDIDGDGALDVGGRYDILFNRQVKFQDEEGEISADCIEPAVYKFRMTSRGLRFYLLGDQCLARASLFKETLIKATP